MVSREHGRGSRVRQDGARLGRRADRGRRTGGETSASLEGKSQDINLEQERWQVSADRAVIWVSVDNSNAQSQWCRWWWLAMLEIESEVLTKIGSRSTQEPPRPSLSCHSGSSAGPYQGVR